MRVVIHHWSATGNTALAARLAEEALNEAGAVVTVESIRTADPQAIPACDLWVIASPVFDFRPALPVEAFVKRARVAEGTPAAAIFTCAGFPDRAPTYLARWLRRAGARPWDWTGLMCEDAWPVLRRIWLRLCSVGHPTEPMVDKFRAWWRNAPGRLERGELGRRWWRIPTPLTPFSWFYRPWLMPHWFKIWVDTGRCTRCGECVERCPTGRMRIKAFPKPKGACVGCYGCVNACPVDAVDTWFTRSAPRYRGPLSRQTGVTS